MYTHRTYRTAEQGFSLIELMVTVGILSLITGLVLTNHNKFGGQILLRTLAYDMALTIRQAQTYGISVRRTNESINTFSTGYGMHFTSSSFTTYSMFSDTYKIVGGIPTLVLANEAGNSIYDTSNENVQVFTIGRGYKIKDLCATNAAGAEVCNSVSSGVTSLDIVFKRPEPDAEIRINGATTPVYRQAKILLTSPRGDVRTIVVEVSGQISVQ